MPIFLISKTLLSFSHDGLLSHTKTSQLFIQETIDENISRCNSFRNNEFQENVLVVRDKEHDLVQFELTCSLLDNSTSLSLTAIGGEKQHLAWLELTWGEKTTLYLSCCLGGDNLVHLTQYQLKRWRRQAAPHTIWAHLVVGARHCLW